MLGVLFPRAISAEGSGLALITAPSRSAELDRLAEPDLLFLWEAVLQSRCKHLADKFALEAVPRPVLERKGSDTSKAVSAVLEARRSSG